MKMMIATLAFFAAANAHATIGPCAAKVKAFAEKIASESLDIVPAGQYTSIEPTGKNSVKVEMVNETGTRIRSLIIQQNENCEITGVQSEMDLAPEL